MWRTGQGKAVCLWHKVWVTVCADVESEYVHFPRSLLMQESTVNLNALCVYAYTNSIVLYVCVCVCVGTNCISLMKPIFPW